MPARAGARLGAPSDDLAAAFSWAHGRGDAERCLRLAIAVAPYSYWRDSSEAVQLLATALELDGGRGDPRLRAAALVAHVDTMTMRPPVALAEARALA